jgi:nucleoside-diphosphate-sugar epimerase
MRIDEGSTVAITGVGGFIGQRIASRMRARGARVRGLDHAPAALARAVSLGVQARAGDVCDPEAVAWLCDGATAVIHTAAVVGEGGDRALYDRVNVGGARAVLEGARRAGAALVHLSSVMVYGFEYPDGVTEEGPFRGEGNAYCESKLEGDRAVLAAAREGSARAAVVRPGDVYGVGSVPWVERPLGLMRRGLFVLPDDGRGLLNHVHVENLVDAIESVLARDAWGRAFNVTDGRRTRCREYFDLLAAATGLGAPRALPSWLLRPAFDLLAVGARAIGRAPLATGEAVAFLTRPGVYAIDRARSELGFSPRISLEEGLAELSAARGAPPRS